MLVAAPRDDVDARGAWTETETGAGAETGVADAEKEGARRGIAMSSGLLAADGTAGDEMAWVAKEE